MKKNIFTLFGLLFFHTIFSQTNYRFQSDIQYQSDTDPYIQERCKLDIYYPENQKDFATIVWFHGGGLSSGNKHLPVQLENTGLAVVSVNYRLLPKATLTECINDAAAAVAWTFKNIASYSGDPKKIFVSGHSAGGYLTSMVGLDKKWLDQFDVDANDICGLFPFSGHAISHFAYRQSKGMKNTQPSIDEFAPLYYVRSDAPPLIIVSGDREMEMLGRYEENAYFWRMMKVAGHQQTYLYELDGYDHGAMADPAFHILKNHVKQILNIK